MSAHSVPTTTRDSDAQLVQRVAGGDGDAFTQLVDRHQPALTRYAGSFLRRSEHDAEDVVQDVFVRAHAGLCAGERPDDLRPWLYRLTRNRALDEMRRKRWAEAHLEPATTAPAIHPSPELELLGSESLWQLVDDILALPARQRQALLARELEGYTLEEVAARIDVTVAAAQKLASRARENLVRARAARAAGCDVIRDSLLDAHERGVRPTEHAVRHVKGCGACRAFRARQARPARLPAAVAVRRPRGLGPAWAPLRSTTATASPPRSPCRERFALFPQPMEAAPCPHAAALHALRAHTPHTTGGDRRERARRDPRPRECPGARRDASPR